MATETAKQARVPSTPTSFRAKRGVADADLVAGVREHAIQHYNDGGWDEVVEAWEDSKIIEEIGWADTVAGAIRKLRPIIAIIADVRADQMADAKNSAF